MTSMKEYFVENEWLDENSVAIHKYVEFHKRRSDEVGMEPTITYDNIVDRLGRNAIETITSDIQQGGDLLKRYFEGSAELSPHEGADIELVYNHVDRCYECGFEDDEQDEKMELLHVEGDSDIWYKAVWMCPKCHSYFIDQTSRVSQNLWLISGNEVRTIIPRYIF